MSTLATDNFDRANNADLGTVWDVLTGQSAFKIASNAAAPTSISSNSAESNNSVTWPDDQYSQCAVTVDATTTTSDTGIGPAARMSTSQQTAYCLFARHGASTNMSFYKVVNSSFTNLWRRTQSFSDGDTIRLEAQGTTLRVYKIGVQIGADATDSSIASGRAGICYSSAVDTSASVDNWEGGDFGAATTTTIQPGTMLREA